MIVTAPFLRTCRLMIQAPIRLIQHSALSVYASFTTATVLPGNPSDGTQALPCRHIVLLRIRRSFVRGQLPSALAEWVVHPTHSVTQICLCARRIAKLVVLDPWRTSSWGETYAHTVSVPRPGARPVVRSISCRHSHLWIWDWDNSAFLGIRLALHCVVSMIYPRSRWTLRLTLIQPQQDVHGLGSGASHTWACG